MEPVRRYTAQDRTEAHYVDTAPFMSLVSVCGLARVSRTGKWLGGSTQQAKHLATLPLCRRCEAMVPASAEVA